ncbi:hypothetical protein ABZ671_24180 [Micromonospora sp. NPDC006766]|uniref:hypothetical protein n=1 Tax=Micromonospora sp. NPDC006766 TaxID=3154778 RepID=UPI0033C1FCA8
MLKANGKWLATGAAASVLAWIAFITVKVALTPEPGAESPQQLAKDFHRAVADNDVEHARLLIKGDPGKDPVGRTLAAARCSAEPAAVAEQRGDHWYIVIRTEAGIECGDLPAARHADRWFIDLWADPLRPVHS